MNKYRLLLSFLLLASTSTLLAQIPEDCADRQQANNWPEYYCDCKYTAEDFSLPLDIQISDTRWFKGKISDLAQGISAYLNSDCPMKFEVYPFCTSKTPEYEKIFEQNQANSIDGTSIKNRLEEAGYGSVEATFYISISPVNGLGGRLILRPEADGMPSSCDDPLYIFPRMSLYSTQPTDVYVIDPSNIAEATDIIIYWQGDNNTPCDLQLTSNSCDGPLVDEVTLDATHNCYTLTAEVLDEAWFNDEKFFLHFSHAPNTAGFVHCLVPEYTAAYTDTTICQGMGVQLGDTLLTETTTYPIDTIFLHTNQYRVNYLNVIVIEPEAQQDTLAFQYTQQPYLYRSQHTISKPGDYDLTIHTPGACDERYLLHVYHNIDTVVNVKDTFLCYGSSFKYQGKLYSQDVSFGQAVWKNQDTLLIDTLNVYFATTPEIVYDTIMQNQNKYGKTYKQPGEFRFTYTNPNTFCVDSIILLVKPNSDLNIQYDYCYIDTTLCQGMEYEDIYGNVYTESTVLYDTIPRVMNKHYEVEITTITFTQPEIQHDTISLKTTQLPYKYNKYCTVDTFDLYDYTVHVDGRCDERYQLMVLHDIDTTYQIVDTTLCQGKVYTYGEVGYTTDITLVDTLRLDADTYQILTIQVVFTEPDIQPDTLILKTTDLPYTYREQYTVETFGVYDVLIHTPGACDERYKLYVHHDIDTTYQTVDTTLCQGKVYTYGGVEYTTDITLIDTLQLDADTYQILTTQVSFLAPDIQLDTISIKTTDLPYTYREQYTVETFGGHDVLIHTPGSCDERYQLQVLHDIDTTYQTVDTTLCQGKVYTYGGVEYTTDITLVDTLQLDADTYQILTIQVVFSEPDIQYDTISIKTTDLPYTYREQYEVTDFGNHDVVITLPNTCDERYYLQVLHDIDTLVLETDTFLCYGKVFVQDMVEYQVDTVLQFASWLNGDTLQIDILNISFATLPDVRYDTLTLTQSELPYQYCDTSLAAFGDYELMLYNEEGCLEQVNLSVQERIIAGIDNTSLIDRPRLILRNGVVYILRGSETFTLLGEKI